jgi:hypothetical protein
VLRVERTKRYTGANCTLCKAKSCTSKSKAVIHGVNSPFLPWRSVQCLLRGRFGQCWRIHTAQFAEPNTFQTCIKSRFNVSGRPG